MRKTYVKGIKRIPILVLVMLLLTGTGLYAQKTVSGVVTDDAGEPMPGVNVLVKGTSTGTVTGFDGSYSLSLNADQDVLVFSFVGFKSTEVAVGNRSVIDVGLESDLTALEEVVVIGYGTVESKLVTGSVAGVDSEEIKNLSAGQAQQAIQGRIAGISVQPQSGAPGSGFNVRVRGTGSNGNSEPLYIVDGMRTTDISFLSVNEIESFDVLKDGASAAIYGAEGGNGVVIITTKSGSTNRPAEVNYQFQYGTQSVDNTLDLMNAQEHAIYMEEAGLGRTPADVSGNGTNWLDEIFEDAPFQQHTLSVSGGSAKNTYFLQLGYYDQDGVIGGDKSNYNRYNVRLNMKSDVKDWLAFQTQVGYIRNQKTGITEDSEFGGVISNAILMDPATPVYTSTIPDFLQTRIDDGSVSEDQLLVAPNGQYYAWSNFVGGEIYNPLASIDQVRGNGNIENKIFGTVSTEISPFRGLTVTSRLGLDSRFGTFHQWQPSFWFTDTRQSGQAAISQVSYRDYRVQWENFANYEKTIGENDFQVLVGTSIYENFQDFISGVGTGLIQENDNFAFLTSVPDRVNGTNADANEATRTLASVYGRLSYSYGKKYLLNASIRRDGSSMLADGNKWGVFPAVSAGWVVSAEDFFNVSAMNFLKVKASWGQNGSLSNLFPGQWKGTINFGFQYPDGNGQLQTGAEPGVLTNRDLTWETSEQINLGFEAGFLNDALSLNFDWYSKETKDLITTGFIANFVGNNAPPVNLGAIKNSGIEIALNYKNNVGDFSYEIGANASFIDNEVTQLNENIEEVLGPSISTSGWNATGFKEGLPAWYFRGYETDGIFQDQAEIDAFNATLDAATPHTAVPGDPIPVDTNGDGQITPDDHTYIGDPYADVLYGSRIYVNYKGFDVTMFLQGTVGSEKLIGFQRGDRITSNKPSFFFDDRWTENNPTDDWFRATADASVAYQSDFMVFSGDYMRIKQLQFGYNFPKTVLDNISLSTARIYVSFDNFFTFTDYPGLDPEASSFNSQLIGVDRGFYPSSRTFNFGVNVGF
ncbi:MAG: TonB-dependent receptor [bacterium]|nr:TonB-dependent receptor [bacterium]